MDSASSAVVWLSIDPRTHARVQYDDSSAAKLEAAFQAHKDVVKLQIGGNDFEVRLSSMKQVNAMGGSRKVIREVTQEIPKPVTRPVALTATLCASVIQKIAQMSAFVVSLEKSEAALAQGHPVRNFEDVLLVFNVIIDTFAQPRYRAKYRSLSSDDGLLRISVGDPVPSYFANVSNGESIFYRKFVALLGLRNLVHMGLDIYSEMSQKMFSGCLEDYASGTGPHKMKTYTGNAVDLDTCIIRCHEQQARATVNMLAAAEGLPPLTNADDMANSNFVRQIVLSQATTLIDAFCDHFKLKDPARLQQRHLDIKNMTTRSIPTAVHNTDRGRAPVWLYKNVGVVTFHANVPTMPDVYGALLLSPWHLVKGFINVHQSSSSQQEFEENLDDFFENAVADSCFNAKWKAIEAFCAAQDQRGTVDDVLNTIQRNNQASFLAFHEDDDDREALALMMSLAIGVNAIDPRTRRTRRINAADVKAWHAKYAALS